MWHTLVVEVLKNLKKSLSSIYIYILLYIILLYIIIFIYIIYIIYKQNFFLTLGTHMYRDYEI